MNTSSGAVYVVAKAPRSGMAKTRLCPPLTADQAAQLAAAFLLDTLAVVAQAELVPRVICAQRQDEEMLSALVGPAIHVSSQSGRGLGDALETAFRRGLADGFERVAVLGADSPTLPSGTLRDAFSALQAEESIALGPSRDGGYYLLAARSVHPVLFRDMIWSTADVATETLRRGRAANLDIHVLPTWYDVDDAASLTELDAELRVLPAHVAGQTRAARRSMQASDVGQPARSDIAA